MTDEERPVKPPAQPAQPFARGAMLGVPLERSENFRGSVMRLMRRLRVEGFRVGGVFLLAVSSVILFVLGPRVLGAATNVIVDGLQSPNGIDLGKLHRTLLLALGLYVISAVLALRAGVRPRRDRAAHDVAAPNRSGGEAQPPSPP